MIRVTATDTGGLVTITDYEIFVSNENERLQHLSSG